VNVTSVCPKCLASTRVDGVENVVCRRCGERREMKPTAETLTVCGLCGCGYFYVEKDFNAWLGGAIMIAAVAGFLWAQSWNILVGFAFLGGAALLDFVMYLVCPLRTICYKCLAVYRGAPANPSHKTYDLGIAARHADDYERRRAP